MSVNSDGVRERLLAYILPREPETDVQQAAFERAVEAQVAFEEAGFSGLPGNVASMSNDGVSMTFRSDGVSAGYTEGTICPTAWAILRNARLIAYALPTAKKR